MVNRRRFPTTLADSQPAVSELEPLERSELQARLGAVVEGQGLWCEEVVVGGQPGDRVLSVVVDRFGEDAGIELDDIAAVAQEISELLDTIDEQLVELRGETYTLEVTTPGTDRPLVRPHHWEKNIGRIVSVSVDGNAPQDAKIFRLDADGVELSLITPGAKKGMPAKYAEPVYYDYTRLANAVVQVQLK